MVLPRRATYTVDDLFEMPEDGRRYEVFGGALHVSPAPAPLHQIVIDNLSYLLRSIVRPLGAIAVPGVAVRVTDEDGPIHDLAVISRNAGRLTGAVPLDAVYSTVEVVSPSSTLMDRTLKPALCGDAGIPCYWRIELKPTRKYAGPLPLVVVRVADGIEWRTVEAAAGAVAELPLAVGPKPEDLVSISLDPGTLVDH
jgi:Uma2 family endonuclease